MTRPLRLVDDDRVLNNFNIVDADHRVVCKIPSGPGSQAVAEAIVNGFNERSWWENQRERWLWGRH